jgi:hypothetical protein
MALSARFASSSPMSRLFPGIASLTGISLGGYLGLTIGWIEGIELNFMGGVLGLDIRRPALKLPAIGRLGPPLTQ